MIGSLGTQYINLRVHEDRKNFDVSLTDEKGNCETALSTLKKIRRVVEKDFSVSGLSQLQLSDGKERELLRMATEIKNRFVEKVEKHDSDGVRGFFCSRCITDKTEKVWRVYSDIQWHVAYCKMFDLHGGKKVLSRCEKLLLSSACFVMDCKYLLSDLIF